MNIQIHQSNVQSEYACGEVNSYSGCVLLRLLIGKSSGSGSTPTQTRPDQTGRVNRPTGKGTRKRSTARPAASPADTTSRTRLSRSAAYFVWDAAAEGRAKAAAAFQARWALQRWGLWNYLTPERTYRTPNYIIMSGGGEARSTK